MIVVPHGIIFIIYTFFAVTDKQQICNTYMNDYIYLIFFFLPTILQCVCLLSLKVFVRSFIYIADKGQNFTYITSSLYLLCFVCLMRVLLNDYIFFSLKYTFKSEIETSLSPIVSFTHICGERDRIICAVICLVAVIIMSTFFSICLLY